MTPDEKAIHELKNWMRPRVAADPAMSVISLTQALADAGFAVLPMTTATDMQDRAAVMCEEAADRLRDADRSHAAVCDQLAFNIRQLHDTTAATETSS